MDASFAEAGLAGLFLLSLLASTILPLGSEWLLVLLLTQNVPPTACLLTASVGNTLGALTLWWMGLYGWQWLRQRKTFDPGRQKQARRLYRRFGSWSLLLAWLPLVGDGLCLLAGAAGMDWRRFLVLVGTGKTLRYLFVTLVTLQLI
ncbi:MAG: DedA family protein [Deltaproteobacteria bacterium]|nr:MAG: DedA family protein [Deltaproteobacteria bacterium]